MDVSSWKRRAGRAVSFCVALGESPLDHEASSERLVGPQWHWLEWWLCGARQLRWPRGLALAAVASSGGGAPVSVLWQRLGAVKSPAPSLHPSPGQYGVARDAAGLSPWLVPQPLASPQPALLWAAGLAEGKEKAAPVTPLGVPQGTRRSSSRCPPKQLCGNNRPLHGGWFMFLSRALHNMELSSAPGASASPAAALWGRDGLSPGLCAATHCLPRL